jgi:hypothetical protein
MVRLDSRVSDGLTNRYDWLWAVTDAHTPRGTSRAPLQSLRPSPSGKAQGVKLPFPMR